MPHDLLQTHLPLILVKNILHTESRVSSYHFMCLNSRKIVICAHQLSLVNYALAHTQVTCTSIPFHSRLREGKDEGIALKECFAFAYKKKFIETCLNNGRQKHEPGTT